MVNAPGVSAGDEAQIRQLVSDLLPDVLALIKEGHDANDPGIVPKAWERYAARVLAVVAPSTEEERRFSEAAINYMAKTAYAEIRKDSIEVCGRCGGSTIEDGNLSVTVDFKTGGYVCDSCKVKP